MSNVNNFICGSFNCNDVDWGREINGSLQSIVSPYTNKYGNCYRINLRNMPTTNLSAVAALINHLQKEKIRCIELLQLNCDKKVFKELLNRIPLDSLKLDVTVVPGKKAGIDALINEMEDELEEASITIKQAEPEARQQMSFEAGDFIADDVDPSVIEYLFQNKEVQKRPAVLLDEGQFGRFSLEKVFDLAGNKVPGCHLYPSRELFRDQKLQLAFAKKLLVSETEVLIIHKPEDISPAQSDIVKLMSSFMKCVPHVVFQNFGLSGDNFKDLAMQGNAELEVIQFESEIEGDGWVDNLPLLINNYPNLLHFACKASAKINNLDFIDAFIKNAPNLIELKLPQVRFNTEVLIDWLTKSKFKRKEELTVTLKVDTLSPDLEEVLVSMIEQFNEANEGSLTIDVEIMR